MRQEVFLFPVLIWSYIGSFLTYSELQHWISTGQEIILPLEQSFFFQMVMEYQYPHDYQEIYSRWLQQQSSCYMSPIINWKSIYRLRSDLCLVLEKYIRRIRHLSFTSYESWSSSLQREPVRRIGSCIMKKYGHCYLFRIGQYVTRLNTIRKWEGYYYIMSLYYYCNGKIELELYNCQQSNHLKHSCYLEDLTE